MRFAAPVYWAQVQVYMAYLAVERTLFAALNKDTQALAFEVVEFDSAAAQELSDKAVAVLRAVEAGELLPRVDPVDAGQLRGISRFAPAIVKLFLLDQYDDAELDRKKVAAMHALFITTPAPGEPFDATEGKDEAEERTMDLQPGQVVMLEPGEEIQTSAPADVGGTYEPFQYRTLLQVSAALGVPYAYLSNDMIRANYSNARLALLEFRRRVEAYQPSLPP